MKSKDDCPDCGYPREKHCKGIGLTEEQENQYVPCEYCFLKERNRDLETWLYRAIRELDYIQTFGEEAVAASCPEIIVTPVGEEIIERGMKLLGVSELSAEELSR